MGYNLSMVNIVNKTSYKDFEDFYPEIEKYYKKTLKLLGLEDNYEMSIVICGPISIRRINREYRNIDKVTDVISFALLDDGQDEYYDGAIELGDIFINRNRVYSQAQEYGHSIKREFLFLFVHGLLHLLGYDHMCIEDEKVMFGLQKKIIGNLK